MSVDRATGIPLGVSHTPAAKRIGTNIRTQRERKDMTVLDVAKKSDVDPQTSPPMSTDVACPIFGRSFGSPKRSELLQVRSSLE